MRFLAGFLFIPQKTQIPASSKYGLLNQLVNRYISIRVSSKFSQLIQKRKGLALKNRHPFSVVFTNPKPITALSIYNTDVSWQKGLLKIEQLIDMLEKGC